MHFPKYSYPPGLIARLARDVVLSRPRDFQRDAMACLANLHPPLHVSGQEHIPRQGPGVLTINHYHRHGFGAQWLTLAVSGRVPVHVHWLITGELMHQGKWYQPFGTRISRIVLKRIAQIYGFTTMPPMPPRPRDVAARAASVRAVLEYVRRTKDALVGFAPEGQDPLDGVLTHPAPGVGRFGLLLARAGMTFTPAGLYETDRILHLHFGERYELQVGGNGSPDERDEQAVQIIMQRIACLIPLQLRGEFA